MKVHNDEPANSNGRYPKLIISWKMPLIGLQLMIVLPKGNTVSAHLSREKDQKYPLI
ncbi:hypothetical protein [Mesobacillus foraminis]|uniref:hypothetical protein n=1 Tax=Mesobacillus foraminis TaxID=279826 RepID=UPI0013CE6451|nr:hypothetical protein [Mesobacillus foraminis]